MKMKPIKLVIKGLNSFIEEQTIDFEKLTDRGLFGIFGPTGSGKSTILDGITLALYGDIARKSSNFINTNCNDLNVSYTFQISGTPNRIYVVSRHFKRDKKTGNAKTHAAMVKEITGGQEEILAESATTVNKTCREILGLSLEDFTRTVVLPQGKFSEFLKLEGKQRREMLERLFNLQDYGEKLGQRLSKQINAENDKINKLLGEMNSYEGISDEKLAEEKKHLAEITGVLQEAKKKQDEVEGRYKKGEEIWKMQSELAGYQLREKELEAKAQNIEEQMQKVKQGESASKVYPFLEGYEKTQKELADGQEEHSRLTERSKELTISKQQAELAYEKANKEKNEKLPELKDKGNSLDEAITEADKLEEAEVFIKRVEAGLKTVVKDIQDSTREEKAKNLRLKEITTQISKLQSEEASLKVEETIRMMVQQGLGLTQAYDSCKKTLDKDTHSYNEALEIKKADEAEQGKMLRASEEGKAELTQLLAQQSEHLKEAPITREALLEKQEKLVEAKEKYARLEKLNLEKQSYEASLQRSEIDIKQQAVKLEEKKAVYEAAKEAYEQAKLENLAHLLRAKLQEGMPCPVCGSTTHHLESLKSENSEALNALENAQNKAEEQYKVIEQALNELQMKQGVSTANLKRIQEESIPLEAYFQEESMQDKEKHFAILSDALNQYEEKKETLEKKVNELKEKNFKLEADLGQKNTKIEETQKQLMKLETDIKESQKVLQQTQMKLEQLKKEAGTDDFNRMSQEILSKDRKRDALSKQISEQSEEKEKLTKEREEVQKHLSERRVKLGSGMAKFDETQKKREGLILSMGKRLQTILKPQEDNTMQLNDSLEKTITFLKEQTKLKEMIKGKVTYVSILQGDISSNKHQAVPEGQLQEAEQIENVQNQKVTMDTLAMWFMDYPALGECVTQLKVYLMQVKEEMVNTSIAIEQNYVATEAHKNKVDTDYDNVNRQLVEVTTKLEAYEKRLQTEKDMLEKQLREENLTEAEVKLYLMPKEEIEGLKKNISAYQEEKSKLAGSIETITNKLEGQRFEEEEWISLQEERKQILGRVEEITKTYINLTTLVKQIETALIKMGELREKKQKIEHRMAILADLGQLFKGKKFVEFVAATRLKYISLEASKKLKEITNGIYGLEVDENGKFIIRDYKNGGAKRDASTLSGGETFLASLALALALSAEIQLKGTAPLELFFLDEGFGTLDDDLLEVVMGSLEKIHHDKLKVGIISHVEAIKNRVPVKLILTPAEAGKGGTKVKLERS